MINKNLIYERSENCFLEEMDNEILLYNPQRNATLHLNDSSALVWKILDGETSLKEVITYLQKQYPEAKDQIDQDVTELLTQLLKEGAVELVNAE